MALLKEEGSFTHVIAIDFGTGASGYGIAPKILDPTQKPKIEVFNPCDESDDQKTQPRYYLTMILISLPLETKL